MPQNRAAGVKGKGPAESGSTIFLSKLPVDVGEKEVEVSAHDRVLHPGASILPL